MTQVLVAIGVLVVALGVGTVLRRRRPVDAPTQAVHTAPVQIDRTDFAAPEVPWLVVVFSSASCSTCADVIAKAEVLGSADVAVVNVEYPAAADIHRKYRIDAVPIVIIADRAGVVRADFVGPVTATDLWAAVAETRE